MADNLEHEMRTPLASISASLKNLAEELKDQPDHVGNYVNWALGDIKRLEDLLTDIRDATSLKNALSQGFKERFNLSEALAMWLHHSWKPVFTGVEFVCRTPEKDVFIHGDPDRIRQMLDKLIENSVAFHRSGTAIELHLSNEKNHHLVQIINKGPSIPEDMREQIFNSMVSLRGKKDGRPHLGLGLYIVRAIAEHHGGTITASNLAGEEEGVCFSIRLPAISLADS
jgi:signal transduction histidine kinase